MTTNSERQVVTPLDAIRKRDANTESVKYSWPCADRRELLKVLDEERLQYISLVGQTQEALEKIDTLLSQVERMRTALKRVDHDAMINPGGIIAHETLCAVRACIGESS